MIESDWWALFLILNSEYDFRNTIRGRIIGCFRFHCEVAPSLRALDRIFWCEIDREHPSILSVSPVRKDILFQCPLRRTANEYWSIISRSISSIFQINRTNTDTNDRSIFTIQSVGRLLQLTELSSNYENQAVVHDTLCYCKNSCSSVVGISSNLKCAVLAKWWTEPLWNLQNFKVVGNILVSHINSSFKLLDPSVSTSS